MHIWINLSCFYFPICCCSLWGLNQTQAGLFSRTLFEFVPDRNALWGFCPSSSTVLLIPCSVPLGHHGAIGAQWGPLFLVYKHPRSSWTPFWCSVNLVLAHSAPTKWVNILSYECAGRENRRFRILNFMHGDASFKYYQDDFRSNIGCINKDAPRWKLLGIQIY